MRKIRPPRSGDACRIGPGLCRILDANFVGNVFSEVG
jgi:hypothetical protein